MAFMNNGGFNNANNNGGGEKKKSNFRVGKLYGDDGIMDITVWKSDTGIFTILSIKASVGKDPSTGAPVYEQKAPNELPRVFLNGSKLCTLIEAMTKNDPAKANFTLDGRSKITFQATSGAVKVTINDPKNGDRTVTFPSVTCADATIFAEYSMMIEYLKMCYRKMLTNKLDPEEFAAVINTSNDGDGDEESPF